MLLSLDEEFSQLFTKKMINLKDKYKKASDLLGMKNSNNKIEISSRTFKFAEDLFSKI